MPGGPCEGEGGSCEAGGGGCCDANWQKSKYTEKCLSQLVYARRRAQLLAPYEGAASPYDPDRLTDEDRRRVESCSGVLGHEWMGMPPRSARIGTNPPRLPGPEYRRLLQFRLGLPMDRETAAGRECRVLAAGGRVYFVDSGSTTDLFVCLFVCANRLSFP